MTWLSRAIACLAFAGIGLLGLARLTLWIRWRCGGRPRARVCADCGQQIAAGVAPATRTVCTSCLTVDRS